MPYATIEDVRCRFPVICGTDLDTAIEDADITKWLTSTAADIDQELCHRYDVPFASPYPAALVGWNADMAAFEVLARKLSSIPALLVEARDRALAKLRAIAETAEDLCGALVRDPEGGKDGPYVTGAWKTGLFPCPPIYPSEYAP